MSLALHAHQMLIIATLAFAAAVLTTEWYTSPNQDVKRNVFQICVFVGPSYFCQWILLPTDTNAMFRTSIFSPSAPIDLHRSFSSLFFLPVFPILVPSLAIGCAGFSLFALLLGSWYIQRFAGDLGSKWLLLLTIVTVLFSCPYRTHRFDSLPSTSSAIVSV